MARAPLFAMSFILERIQGAETVTRLQDVDFFDTFDNPSQPCFAFQQAMATSD
jgi:hypothetical protein